jgi:hypothetical protein
MVTRDEVRRFFDADSCIASTRAVMEVLRYYATPARAVAVRVVVWNRLAAELTEQKIPKEEWPAEAWSVGIAGKSRWTGDGRWDGHLVAVTPTRLLDVSMDQMDRPRKGIHLPPGAFVLPDDGLPEGEFGFRRDDGIVVLYEATGDGFFRRSSNWSGKHPDIRRAVAAAIRQLNERWADG